MNQEIYPVSHDDLDAWGIKSFLHKPIHFTADAEPLGADKCHIWPYIVEGEKESDGAFFIIPPHSETAVARIEFAEVEIDIIDGQGVCVSVERSFNSDRSNSDRYVSLHQLIRHSHLSFRYNETYCLKTGRKGMIAQVKTAPPYKPGETEVLLPENDPRALKDFWLTRSLPYDTLYMAAETPPGP